MTKRFAMRLTIEGSVDAVHADFYAPTLYEAAMKMAERLTPELFDAPELRKIEEQALVIPEYEEVDWDK